MKHLFLIFSTLALAVVLIVAASAWRMGEGDSRDRNLQESTLARLCSIPDVEAHQRMRGDGLREAVAIYYVPDSLGIIVERNARVVANDDCTEIVAWENLDSQILTDAKRQIEDKMHETGLPLDGSLIDALIKLKGIVR